MHLCVVTIIIVFAFPAFANEEVTLPVKERVNFLKYKIKKQIQDGTKDKLRYGIENKHHLLNENYDYVDLSQVPITPIMENDERKRDGRFKLRQLRTTTTSTTTFRTTSQTRRRTTRKIESLQLTTTTSLPLLQPVFNPLSDDALSRMQMFKDDNIFSNKKASSPQPVKKHKRKKEKGDGKNKMDNKRDGSTAMDKGVSESPKPLDIFYRRDDPSQRNVPLEWAHCEDLVTPYFTGVQPALVPPDFITANHRTIQRLTHLLGMNVTKYTKAEIYSLMYQISNIQIRLFMWEVAAVKKVMDVILGREKKHSFRLLKYGLKRLFKSWHLDFTNTTNLLAQSRLFRPYCINNVAFDGSTKSSRVPKYIPTTPQSSCEKE